MKKSRKKSQPNPISSQPQRPSPKTPAQEHNYELKSEAVDELVEAKAGNAPEYSEEELNQYRKKSYFNIPDAAKVLFIKGWFAGAVCYFVLWGLGTYVGNTIDMLFILGMVLGMVTDLLTNNVVRFIEKVPGENEKWILINKRGSLGLFANLICSMVIIVCVFVFYDFINRVAAVFTGNPEDVVLGVEPVFFGLFCLGFELALIWLKKLICKIFRR